MQRYFKFLQSIIPEKQQKCTKASSCYHNIQERKYSLKSVNFLTQSHPATTLPSQLSCSIPDIIYVSCFEFFIFLSHSLSHSLSLSLSISLTLYNCQMFKCQITFSKVILSVSNNLGFTGWHLNATNFYGAMLVRYTI